MFKIKWFPWHGQPFNLINIKSLTPAREPSHLKVASGRVF